MHAQQHPHDQRNHKAPHAHHPYGEPKEHRSEHRVLKIGHIFRPEYSRKLVRMITRVFR